MQSAKLPVKLSKKKQREEDEARSMQFLTAFAQLALPKLKHEDDKLV